MVTLFTVTIGNWLKLIVPDALILEQLVVVSVIITLYVPAIPVVMLLLLPGFKAPVGTVQT